MGFGTLFIGYFLLLNVTYYSFTDLVAGLIMLLGLYKLSRVNKNFLYGAVAAGIFSAIGLWEFISQIISMFGIGNTAHWIIPALRSLTVCALTVLILLGIKDVATEVDLPKQAARAKRMIPVAFIVYALFIVFEAPDLFSGIDPVIVTAIFFIVLLASIFLVIYDLITIYSCYMQICMPSELTQKEKKSRFELVNKFREHEAERAREYAEYKIEKRKNKDKNKK